MLTPQIALALEIVDALMVTSPRAWVRVRLRLERRDDARVRVAEITTEIAEGATGERPELGLEVGSFHGVLNEALADLDALTRANAASAVVERVGEAARVSLLREDGSVVESIDVGDGLLHQRVFTDGLFDALADAELTVQSEQERLAQVLRGHDGWEFDASASVLRLARGDLPWSTLPAIPVGRFDATRDEWMWAWLDDSLPDATRVRLHRARDEARAERALGVLQRRVIPCTEGFALRLASLFALRLGARAIYGGADEEGVSMYGIVSAT